MLIFCLCDTGGRGVLRFSSGLKIDKSAKINCLKTIIIEMSWYLYLFTAKLRNVFSSITASVNRMKLVGDWSHIAIIIEHKYIAKLPSAFAHFLRIWNGGKGGCDNFQVVSQRPNISKFYFAKLCHVQFMQSVLIACGCIDYGKACLCNHFIYHIVWFI